MEVGNVFSTDKDGNVNYFSELHKQIFLNAIKGNGYEILGNTEDEAISFAQSAADSLSSSDGYNNNIRYMREKEKRFYEAFIDNLK
jgi:hypothetical protein